MLKHLDWGLIPYGQAYEQQQALFAEALRQKSAGEAVQNTVVFCEHPPVFTLGKHGLASNLLASEAALAVRGIEVFAIDRGGDITCHCPGQLVVYPIIDLEVFHIGLKTYIHRLEEAIIRVLAVFGICGERLDGATGVWLDRDDPRRARKIAAIGVRCSRYITMHGLALNVNTDLGYFKLINPCGFVDKGVTSMQQELGREVDMDAVKRLFDEYWTFDI
ncbi:octanoyltransferase [Bacteroidia bacterium]|nr:octanoyltransferase [Bacteroidia bacterium]